MSHPQKKNEEQPTKVMVMFIKKVHPKIVVVVPFGSSTEVTLPIKSDIYKLLIKVSTMPREQRLKWYPLVFTLDEKGYVIDIVPHRIAKEREAKKDEN